MIPIGVKRTLKYSSSEIVNLTSSNTTAKSKLLFLNDSNRNAFMFRNNIAAYRYFMARR